MKSRFIYSILFIKSLFVLFVFCLPLSNLAQEWAISLGDLEYDSARSVQETAGYDSIVAT